MGFVACGGDRCIYEKKNGDNLEYWIDYGPGYQDHQRFHINDIGFIKRLLGMDINCSPVQREMYITQQKHMEETTEMFHQVRVRTTTNPCDPSTELSVEDSTNRTKEK
ncbi:hypothetical protein PsorP6_012623 [Peronosclerospora sorghi]|uniref:Uncharacterized protein n=1 Tax=Peronosclerospora sorghi TaxID=230839 RepID=A0ACC0WGX2_9STRA|nr:hypothetical protein PsorP6_012623 [Peronosclerospora sorghi]